MFEVDENGMEIDDSTTNSFMCDHDASESILDSQNPIKIGLAEMENIADEEICVSDTDESNSKNQPVESDDAFEESCDNLLEVLTAKENSEQFEVPDSRNMLFDGSKLTVEEAVLEIMEIFVRFKITKQCLQALITFASRILPDGHALPQTYYLLLEYVKKFSPFMTSIRHYYCKVCLYYVGSDEGSEDRSDQPTFNSCPACSSENPGVGFFFEIDIEEQIRYLFEYRNLADKIKTVENSTTDIRDITDGSEYKRAAKGRRKFDLTLMLNTDGVQIYSSSKVKFWPLIFTFAELPKELRTTFSVVLGVWYDAKKKPLMNTFLRPFAVKLSELARNGIGWQHPSTKTRETSKISCPLVIADAPARADVQNIQNHNGSFGCNLCEIKTVPSVKIPGKKNVRVYPYIRQADMILREKERMEEQSRLARLSGDHCVGVKGSSIISILPGLDRATAFFPEFMHSGLLGIPKQFLYFWLKKKRRVEYQRPYQGCRRSSL